MALDDYIHLARPGNRADAPLLFLFHGTGGDENQFAGLADQLAPGAAIVAPRGDVSEMGAARFFRRTGEGVYDMADLARATARMKGFVAAHVARVGAPRVLGLGYSNGANILASVMFAAPDLFDEAVLMHPLIPFEPNVASMLAGQRVLITAGRRDPICPPQLTERLNAALRDKGAAVDLVWHDGGHEIRPGELAAARDFFHGSNAEA